MSDLLILKKEYNKILERYQKAEAYVDNPEIPLQTRERWMPEFLKIVGQLNELLKRIGPHEPSEAIHGFKV